MEQRLFAKMLPNIDERLALVKPMEQRRGEVARPELPEPPRELEFAPAAAPRARSPTGAR